MSISVIIPHMPHSQAINDALDTCVGSLAGYDELIVVVNDGIGFAPAVNQGLRLAKGDFLVVVNNDTILKEGTLRDLVDENAVTSPVVNGGKQDFWGCFFCLPRWVYEKLGGLSEDYGLGYFEDDDYIQLMQKHGVPSRGVDRVHITHPGGNTMRVVETKTLYEDNKQRFEKKWGK